MKLQEEKEKMNKVKFNKDVCLKDHDGAVPSRKIADLPESQAGAWRHRCAACAYQMGFEDAVKVVSGRKRVAREKIEQLTQLALVPDHTHT